VPNSPGQEFLLADRAIGRTSGKVEDLAADQRILLPGIRSERRHQVRGGNAVHIQKDQHGRGGPPRCGVTRRGERQPLGAEVMNGQRETHRRKGWRHLVHAHDGAFRRPARPARKAVEEPAQMRPPPLSHGEDTDGRRLCLRFIFHGTAIPSRASWLPVPHGGRRWR
jgi:hypothetical protein